MLMIYVFTLPVGQVAVAPPTQPVQGASLLFHLACSVRKTNHVFVM